jgi:hypothetical protein
MKYSKSTNGFYMVGFSEIEIPNDAVEISDELYLQMMQGQTDGQKIVCGDLGLPVLVPNQTQTEPPKVA